ncbi:MAG: phenylalanine--tRNA ligase subunit alpha [Firmicutes bacterium]|nr:phenylalanine--tRNA ligase subunit alpha [Bacillota bacterium]
MKEQVIQVRDRALAACQEADSVRELEDVRVRFLGKKGELTQILRGMGQLSPEERPVMGKLVNEVREEVERALAERGEILAEAELTRRLSAETLDLTLPGRRPQRGTVHPVNLILAELERVFVSMGFEVVEGPEVETDYYNFEALNVPPDHPARDMQDTFYLDGGFLLRSQTSPVQVRVMEKQAPPVRIICPGKVYRRDSDATHTPMFHQVEGLVVDKGVTLGDLKGTLMELSRVLYGDRKVRFRPSFFPFTEPSAEMDVACVVCEGTGCRVCKGSGWLEVLGCGMVHPKVFEMVGYDPDEVTGFAFGLGVERFAMTRYGIEDIRWLYENDLRFLRQFHGR